MKEQSRKMLILMLVILVSQMAFSQKAQKPDVAAKHESVEYALTQPEARDGAYPRMRTQSLLQKRDAIIQEYRKKLGEDPRWKQVIEDIAAQEKKLEALNKEILDRRQLMPADWIINWDEERIAPATKKNE